MIDRYSREEMANIWTDQNRYEAWLEVEILACEAWSELGHIPKEDVKKIRQNAKVDVKRAQEIEQETRHDVVAFTRQVSETLGDERKWVHYGLTSTDVVDTALSYVIKQANEIIEKDIERFIKVLEEKAKNYKYTLMMGRTHGVHAEPTTFGVKMALWYTEMKRNLKRFKEVRKEIEVGKMSGAVGTFANIPPEIEQYVCDHLGIDTASVSTQTLQRDRHAYYIATLALVATSLEKFAVEIRNLQKTETREVEEAFAKGQKGSSAMPHKRNPIGSENITGISRVIRGYITTAYENVPLWHERDISHSSAERIMLPDVTIALDYALNRFTNIVDRLTVFEDNMRNNIDKTFGLIFSQRVLLALINKGMVREEAYDRVQPKAMESWETKTPFRQLIEKDESITNVLSKEELDECFNPEHHLNQVDTIFKRAGLE
ncbi:adenylosuccinate lyase [Staphylococcus sp. EG-SA-6]|jgi:adenylosuccinate lyase|uniref:Adenylosuccinate lyase n=2 Tax=Staphylococcus haemolyticus TaxID=1283 RepID=PUR8_STAHJ|nr:MULTISPECIES: adenylosuccinate lyase [Staphylococcus]Q4L7M3.1 RecName: Full=Adenylosuccinate lyase; Short=ASL; AltName: Full=Adenylosuccinase; Short=ASase [Staphylococcus haemolyticus JCSC1435]KDP56039.1 adenylosuccinate lyase [Staphylococcus aureus subsp. aureus CO-98]MBN4935357.1 adenylosuccinate lyase [Staphylococcus sp. EG-SA-6]AKC75797.1 adenylosuccinate lyase [Staphylococcus haemolyticus]AUV67084.1 adenylosuccinate lyase [Staphylococcus haemolyticus]AUV69463.1 adenylosuccinate lyase 